MSTPTSRRRRRPPISARPVISLGVKRRLAISAVVLFGLLVGIGYRAYSMQVVNADHYRAQADRQHLRTIEVPAPRGAIFDRRGVELAVTADADSVWANPRSVIDPGGTAAALAPILDIPREILVRRLTSERYFIWLRRHVSASTAAEVRELDLPGVEVAREPRRFYPGRSLAGPVLGFADIDGRGLDGLELSMDELLVGTRGQIEGIRDSAGKLMLPAPKADAVAGSSLTLTLDRTVQFLAERAVEKAVIEHSANWGVAIVIEVGTGDVLAMANAPSTDPNRPEPGAAVGRNRAITDAFEIGSVMKLFSVAAALEAGVVTPLTRFKIFGGRMRLPGGSVIRDSFRDNELTVAGIIKRSSNVGAIQIARLLGRDGLHEALLRYRFGQRTGIELRGERAGLVRPARKWGPTDLAVISYGYGMTATPLQAAAALAAIGSDGVYYPPRLVRAVHDPGGRQTFAREPAGERIMTSEVAAEMTAMMRTVFDKGKHGGTARQVVLDGFTAAGKTGTARKIDPSTGTYGKMYLSSFAGLAPAENPRIAVLVLIDEPRSGHYYGSTVAGPAYTEITGGTLKVLGVAPDAPPAPQPEAEPVSAEEPPRGPPIEVEEASEAELEPLPVAPDSEDAVAMPSFVGLTIRQALQMAAARDITIEVRGSGVAAAQSFAPGPAPSDAVVIVEFK